MQIDPAQLAALSAVLRCGAFDLAAAELNVTPSAISQRIKALEDHIGTALVHRGSPCTGTQAGQRLAKHAGDLGLLEAQLIRDLSLTGVKSGARLRLAVNADSLATWFIPALAAVPDVLFDLVIDDQDHSTDWLARGEVSAAIAATDKAARGCDSFALGALRYVATASPAFMERWFVAGVNADTLNRAPCLVFNPKDKLQARWMADVTGARPTPPAHMLPSTHAFIDAAKAGIGWGMNPEVLVRDSLVNGSLVALVPGQPLDVPLFWHVSRALSGAIAPLTRAVRQAAGEGLLR
ncbi:LysR family transcriptional regulator ArgP [Aestuariivita boseongensis]|uniref:LysR family transcriptional regulator ArgP n=1 Tax=Aestuariivita boseongensis TaxID=1470562 RepID=UPI0006832164|nr:LysR family transcriptional regulator ArgP [Aestuariivita boseongensis]